MVSPLASWIERRVPSVPFLEFEANAHHVEWGGFLGIDRYVFLHETDVLSPQSLEGSWPRLRQYVEQACKIISSNTPTWLDSDEVSLILNQLGPPPDQCYPIYLMTIKSDTIPERVVYVGKTSSEINRFAGGHVAITKLHHPKYDGLEKRLYLGCITLLNKDVDYLPLESVGPIEMALRLLRSIEAQLIYHFAPELNSQGKTRCLATDPISLHIQNFCSPFLKNEFVAPPRS